jgi:hypothetical protein
MAGFARGLVPVPDPEKIRRPPQRISSRAA